MGKKLRISEFAKLTGSTLKTILYYHKIGLLQEAERSPGGYRLYGPEELTRMRSIMHLKYLGFDLKHIKETLGFSQEHKTLCDVLQSLLFELQSKKQILEERIAIIESLLKDDRALLDENISNSSSFNMIVEILGPEKISKYASTCPEIFEQQKKLFNLFNDFDWGEDYRDTYRLLAEYFQTHPEQYQESLNYGIRLEKLSQMSEDDPEIDVLARESAEYIKNIPQLRKLLCNQSGIQKPLQSIYNEMITKVISPARIKHMQLLQKYLNS
jgi:DNA-binding transcriptional MerR regulator